MDIIRYNRQAWDHLVKTGDRWTVPFGEAEISKAREGRPDLLLTPSKPVPLAWYPPLKHARVLALASGGGQQVPALAATGAEVTVFDLSEEQLNQDLRTCEKFGFSITAVQGNMMEMSALPDDTYDLVFHPCSNAFVPDLKPVWKACARVMKKGAVLMWGFTKAESMLLHRDSASGVYTLRYKMPYSDLHSLTEEERSVYTNNNEPLIFGHSLEEQMGELLGNGFVITGLFEDDWGGQDPLDSYFPAFVAVRAVKV
ncbi:MAG: class I SAM-dependent methyltransferase [Bacteroidia bacterium]|nr:class I SAM-dependent methyltransferase [Bacteroidia bacterium]